MMFKRTRRLIKRIIRVFVMLLVLIILVLTFALVAPWHFTPTVSSEQSYANWMGTHVDPTTRVVDLAMLGAHDAFAANMTLFSPLDDVALASGYTNALLAPPLGWLIKGFMIRQSNTQVSDAETLLQQGVRYFDVRLSRDDTWHITHNFLAPESVLDIFTALTTFLEAHPGEIVLLDFQWVFDRASADFFANDATYEALLELLDAAGLMSYVIPASAVNLATLTVGETVAQAGGSAVLLIAKTTGHDIFFDRTHVLRSTWFNTDDYVILWNAIQAESATVAAQPDLLNTLRVIQAVKTIQLSETGILHSLTSWSLMNRARLLNGKLAAEESLCEVLETLPILMLDYSDSNHQDALDRFMACIIERAS